MLQGALHSVLSRLYRAFLRMSKRFGHNSVVLDHVERFRN